MDQIICIISDAAAVMQKLAKELGIDIQLCIAHGNHLGILDVIFNVDEGIEEDVDSDFDVEESDSEYEIEQNESDSDDEESDDEEDEPEIEIGDRENIPEFAESFNDLLKRLIKAVNKINFSPVKVWKLQKAVTKWQNENDMDVKELVSIAEVFTNP